MSQYEGELDRAEQTRSRIEEALPYVSLSTETARREVLLGILLHPIQTHLATQKP